MLAYQLFEGMIGGSMKPGVPSGQVVASVSFAIFFCLIAMGLVYYCYFLIDTLATRAIRLKSWFYATVAVILAVSFWMIATLEVYIDSTVLVGGVVLSFNYVATSFVTYIAAHRHV
jgi:hypothetical protein